jgi:type I restriction enzyme S subunit
VGQRADPRTVPADTRLIELEHLGGATGQLSGSSTAGTAISLKAVFQPGDVLFGKLRAYLRKYWLADSGGLCSTEFWVLRPKNNNVNEFVRYTVETDAFVEAASGGYGTHMPRADWSVVRKLTVAIPEPSEQRAIANVLVDADCEIETLRFRLNKAHSIKQGMMQQLLTGRAHLAVPEAML